MSKRKSLPSDNRVTDEVSRLVVPILVGALRSCFKVPAIFAEWRQDCRIDPPAFKVRPMLDTEQNFGTHFTGRLRIESYATSPAALNLFDDRFIDRGYRPSFGRVTSIRPEWLPGAVEIDLSYVDPASPGKPKRVTSGYRTAHTLKFVTYPDTSIERKAA